MEAEKLRAVGVEKIPETPQISESLKAEGVVPRPSEFSAQVTTTKGEPLIQTSQNGVTITSPKSQEELETLSKGDEARSITWFAAYWIRQIKRAVLFGWHIVFKN